MLCSSQVFSGVLLCYLLKSGVRRQVVMETDIFVTSSEQQCSFISVVVCGLASVALR